MSAEGHHSFHTGAEWILSAPLRPPLSEKLALLDCLQPIKPVP